MSLSYRENAKPQVHAVEIKPKNLWCRFRNAFWSFVYNHLGRPQWAQKKLVQSCLSSLPAGAMNCVDCGQDECVCKEYPPEMGNYY